MTFPSSREPLADQLAEVLGVRGNGRVAIQWAQKWMLHIAMEMLQAQILSRRAMIGTGELTDEAVDQTAREVQKRVERVREIVAELRRRGDFVEWEE